MPAFAGTTTGDRQGVGHAWMPAFAGMTTGTTAGDNRKATGRGMYQHVTTLNPDVRRNDAQGLRNLTQAVT